MCQKKIAPSETNNSVHLQSLFFRSTVHGQSMDSPWTVHGQFMDSPWTVHGQSMDCSWTVHGQSMDSPWPRKRRRVASEPVQGSMVRGAGPRTSSRFAVRGANRELGHSRSVPRSQQLTNWKRKIGKTRVGFGRAEVSIPPFLSLLRDLQDGHGFRSIVAQQKR